MSYPHENAYSDFATMSFGMGQWIDRDLYTIASVGTMSESGSEPVKFPRSPPRLGKGFQKRSSSPPPELVQEGDESSESTSSYSRESQWSSSSTEPSIEEPFIVIRTKRNLDSVSTLTSYSEDSDSRSTSTSYTSSSGTSSYTTAYDDSNATSASESQFSSAESGFSREPLSKEYSDDYESNDHLSVVDEDDEEEPDEEMGGGGGGGVREEESTSNEAPTIFEDTVTESVETSKDDTMSEVSKPQQGPSSKLGSESSRAESMESEVIREELENSQRSRQAQLDQYRAALFPQGYRPAEPKLQETKMTLDNVEYLSDLDIASNNNDLSTLEGGIPKERVSSVFNLPLQPPPIISGLGEDVSTLYGGDTTSYISKFDPTIRGYDKNDKSKNSPSEDTSLSTMDSSFWKFLEGRSYLEYFFLGLIVISGSTLIVLLTLILCEFFLTR